jgi:hypothetical protein
MNTIPDQAALAAEIERLRELVLDLGQAVTSFTADVAQLRGRLNVLAPRPAPRPGGLHVIPGGAS